MSRRLAVYVAFVCFLGLLAVVFALAHPLPQRLFDAVAFVIVIYLAEWLAVPLPRESYIGVSFAGYLGAMLVFGPTVPVAAAIVSGFNPVDIKNHKSLPRMLFNSAQYSVASIALYATFSMLGGRPMLVGTGVHAIGPVDVLAVMAGGTAFFLVNTGLIAPAVAFYTNTRVSRAWLENFGWLIPNYAALGVVGILMAATYAAARAPGVVLLVAPMLIARQTFAMYMRRREAYYQTVHSLVAAIEAKDPYTRGHSERVADYAERIAEAMHIGDKAIETLRFAALLHDLGKIGVDRRILNKIGALSEEEYAKVKEHPELAAKILDRIEFLVEAVPAVLSHHERVDGVGYGRGLSGSGIPQSARILAVADCFDAMTSVRPYRDALSTEDAVAELADNSGSQFDPVVVHAFLRAMRLDHLVRPAPQTADGQLSLDEAPA